mmetsp:Transcript_47017/g.90718  ORF Transcript_47017/g.90718 Transcript_47017/m.90718 type:complete len:585 (+) Transcript_47017:46-1800(+)|eukprot:CAMPEP_0172669918 /NCGR_PEP_ID=MMETSP1074-20121228/9971_1 /TAXON_ID=2916 /ORGANISM="Ceratium fusus, Strain PA161109" /LENGTH=584 /DNA_ID=CAMNT_0013486753 /DNA_START=46 /DNA_END=1800 /DNA_ORIENTATION=+
MIEYEARGGLWKLIFARKGSVIPKALVLAIPSAVLAAFLVIFDEMASRVRADVGISNTQSSIIWSTVSVPLISLIGYRTSQAVGRFWEGTSLLHAMRGEWFDSASCLATFSTRSRGQKPREVDQFRQTLLRLMSLCHGSALDEIKMEQKEFFEALDITGLDTATLRILHNCSSQGWNRVEVLLHMIQVLVIDAFDKQIICVPAPILSRVYQTLSRGFVNLLNAKKIRDTQFPFPYAQLIAVLLISLVFLTPLVMSMVFSDQIGWCILSTFMPVFSLLCLNYTAAELEMPYGTRENDLPLHDFQMEMNSSLLMLIHLDSDHVPSTHHRTKTTYDDLSQALQQNRNSMFSQVSQAQSMRQTLRSVYTDAAESAIGSGNGQMHAVASEVLSSMRSGTPCSCTPSLATIEEPDIMTPQDSQFMRDDFRAPCKLHIPRPIPHPTVMRDEGTASSSPRGRAASRVLSPRSHGSLSPAARREVKEMRFESFMSDKFMRAASEECAATKMSNKMSMSREARGNGPSALFLPPEPQGTEKTIQRGTKRHNKTGNSIERPFEREDVLNFTPPEEGTVPSVLCIPTAERSALSAI